MSVYTPSVLALCHLYVPVAAGGVGVAVNVCPTCVVPERVRAVMGVDVVVHFA